MKKTLERKGRVEKKVTSRKGKKQRARGNPEMKSHYFKSMKTIEHKRTRQRRKDAKRRK